MKHLIVVIIATGLLPFGMTGQAISNFKVEYAGALKNMMHKGDISAKAALIDFKNIEHLYALGAMKDLKGEIQIFDSKPTNTMVRDGKLAFDDSFKKNATLLVYASVPEWSTTHIPDSVVTYEELESYIQEVANKVGIDIDEPFPFLLEGSMKSFDWHVINWKDGDIEHSHEKHINSGLHGTLKDRQVEMLGFYSNAHHAVFTHHTTNMHIHVKTVDGKTAGHVDGMTLGGGIVLKLPL